MNQPITQPTQRQDSKGYEYPEVPRVPWSEAGPEWLATWGYPNGQFDPEHVEILGPSGSGKTYFEASILQQRVLLRDSGVIFIATKPADATIMKLGWPVVDNWKDVQKNKQCIFWPKTKAQGKDREAYLNVKIYELLTKLWVKDSYNIVSFDEIATAENLSIEMKKEIQMYWREARSMGITIVAMKQRPQGALRDMHSEANWVVCFKPKDEEDAERYAQILGSKKRWMPVLADLDRDKHEFILYHARTGEAVISWMDVELIPAEVPEQGPYINKGA